MIQFDLKRQALRQVAGLLLSFPTILGLVALLPTAAAAQSSVTAQGGSGGGPFYAPCPSGEYLIGLDLRIADDVDAVRPICGVLNASTVVARFASVGEWHGGSGGGQKQLICPPGTPVMLGMVVKTEGVRTYIVNALTLKCGIRSSRQPGPLGTANVEGPAYSGGGFGGAFTGISGPLVVDCPPNMLAVGIHGRSGIWLDAIGLLCAAAPSGPVGFGRVVRSPPLVGRGSLCDAARDARSRNSPVAGRLEASCRDYQQRAQPPSNVPTIDDALLNDDLPGRATAIVGEDIMLVALRARTPESDRHGFDIGITSSEGQTLWGPGKQKLYDTLDPAGQRGFRTATSFALDRNRNRKLATVGGSIAEADETLSQHRTIDPDPRYWLGFDIATGIFGDPALGAQGNTQSGPGSLGIRDALSPASKRGFNAAMKILLS